MKLSQDSPGLTSGIETYPPPFCFTKLLDVLQNAAKSPGKISFPSPTPGAHATSELSYQELLQLATHNAGVIKALSTSHESKIVLLHFNRHRDNIVWFWSVVKAGLVPAISTPFSADPIQRRKHILHLDSLFQNPICLTSQTSLDQFPEMRQLQVLYSVESLDTGVRDPYPAYQPDEHYPAALMLTSGSTGNAKAVALSTPQMLMAVRGKSNTWKSDKSSVFFNWVGFDHVVNLVEIHLHAMAYGADQIHVQAKDVLEDPLLFLRLIEAYRVNHTFAPNFFLALVDKSLADIDLKDPVWLSFSSQPDPSQRAGLV